MERQRNNQSFFNRVTHAPSTIHNPESLPLLPQTHKHYHGHLNQQRQQTRIEIANKSISERLKRQESHLDSAHSLKTQYKQLREYAKIARKTPSMQRYR